MGVDKDENLTDGFMQRNDRVETVPGVGIGVEDDDEKRREVDDLFTGVSVLVILVFRKVPYLLVTSKS